MLIASPARSITGMFSLITFTQCCTYVSSHDNKSIKEKSLDLNGCSKNIINYTCCDLIYRIPEDSTRKCIQTNKHVWKECRIENQYAQKAVVF